jgi:hypothetical protein
LAQGLKGPRWSQQQAFQVALDVSLHLSFRNSKPWATSFPMLLPGMAGVGLTYQEAPLHPSPPLPSSLQATGAHGHYGPPAPRAAQTPLTLHGVAVHTSAWLTARWGTPRRCALQPALLHRCASPSTLVSKHRAQTTHSNHSQGPPRPPDFHI